MQLGENTEEKHQGTVIVFVWTRGRRLDSGRFRGDTTMRKGFSVVLMATVACVFVAQSARAGVTFDVVFRDATVAGVLTISAGDTGPGCAFGGPWGGSVTSGYCMDVIISSDHDFIGMATSVQYDTSNGLALSFAQEWWGIGVSFNAKGVEQSKCAPFGGPGIVDVGPGTLRAFDCTVPPPGNPPVAPAGTYNIGTIVWDPSAMAAGTSANIAAVLIADEGALPIINGNLILLYSDITLGSRIINVIPEPGTASLLGLGLLGLIVAGRRSGA